MMMITKKKERKKKNTTTEDIYRVPSDYISHVFFCRPENSFQKKKNERNVGRERREAKKERHSEIIERRRRMNEDKEQERRVNLLGVEFRFHQSMNSDPIYAGIVRVSMIRFDFEEDALSEDRSSMCG